MRPDLEVIERRYQFRSETAARDIGILLAYIAELEAERDRAKKELRDFLDGYFSATKQVDTALGAYRQDISQECFESGCYSWATHIAERITALLDEVNTLQAALGNSH